MADKKYKIKNKARSVTGNKDTKKVKTNFSVKHRMLLLVLWGAFCIGLYAALAKISFFFSLYVFVIIFAIAFIMYFITGIKTSRLAEKGDRESVEFIKLIDRSKLLLIIMIPPLFIIIFDFISSSVKIFM